jgi:hypothetical protein
MAALTAASTRRENSGSTTLMVYTFTSVADGDTFASGLGTNVITFNYVVNGNPTTQASAGAGITNSSGTFTIYPGEDSLGGILQVWATV